MNEHMTREELAMKCDWEGGVVETITGYGLGPGYLPDDTPQDVREAWVRVYGMRYDIDLIQEWLGDE